jgi:hypothetical protein
MIEIFEIGKPTLTVGDKEAARLQANFLRVTLEHR